MINDSAERYLSRNVGLDITSISACGGGGGTYVTRTSPCVSETEKEKMLIY